MNLRLIYFILFICLSAAAFATSYSGPVKQTVSSSDGKYCAVIDPAETVQKVYKSDSMKKVLWSFSFTPELDSWFVSNNGQYVVCVRWRFVRVEDLDKPAIVVFRKDGSRSDYSYNSLGGARKTGLFETAPRGNFWRVWYESINIENNRVEIFTHDEKRIVVSGEDGSLNIYRD